jgi:hypothetical protein
VFQAITVTSFGFSDFNALDSLRSDTLADTSETIDDLRSSAVDLNHHRPRVEKNVLIEQNPNAAKPQSLPARRASECVLLIRRIQSLKGRDMHSLALRAGIADQPRSQRCAHGALMIRTKNLNDARESEVTNNRRLNPPMDHDIQL